MSATDSKLGVLIAICGLAAGGCSGADWNNSEAEGVDSTEQSLIGAGTGVTTQDASRTSSDWTTSGWQSESIGASAVGFSYIAYNAEDTNTAHVQNITTSTLDSSGRPFVDRVVCPGTSQVGTNFANTSAGGAYSNAHHLPTAGSGVGGVPDNIIWGDPAMEAYDGYVWLSAVVSPGDRSLANTNTTVGTAKCIRTSDRPNSGFPVGFPHAALAGACMYAATAGFSGGGAYQQQVCFRKGNDFFDGGFLWTFGLDSDNAIYAAYNDSSAGNLVMYRRYVGTATNAWSEVPGDTAVKLKGHPKLVANDDNLYIVSPSGSNALSVWKYNGAAFSAGTVVATDFAGQSSAVTLKDGTTKPRGVNFAARYIWNGAPEKLAIFYQVVNGSRTNLKVLLCDPNTLACTSPGRFGDSTYDAFMPAVTIGRNRANTGYVNAVTFWSDETQTGANVALRAASFTTTGTLGAQAWLTSGQRVCPGGGGDYWGDYDGMWWETTGTTFRRAITDSTWATCDTTSRANLDYRSQDEHVSVVNFSVP